MLQYSGLGIYIIYNIINESISDERYTEREREIERDRERERETERERERPRERERETQLSFYILIQWNIKNGGHSILYSLFFVFCGFCVFMFCTISFFVALLLLIV